MISHWAKVIFALVKNLNNYQFATWSVGDYSNCLFRWWTIIIVTSINYSLVGRWSVFFLITIIPCSLSSLPLLQKVVGVRLARPTFPPFKILYYPVSLSFARCWATPNPWQLAYPNRDLNFGPLVKILNYDFQLKNYTPTLRYGKISTDYLL